MQSIYEIVTDEKNGSQILKKTDPSGVIYWIPMDESNSDYQAYLNKDKPQVEHLTEIITPTTDQEAPNGNFNPTGNRHDIANGAR